MTNDARMVIGWREWVGLPDLGLPWIKAKVDTGARTSSLHAYEVETFERHGARYVRFRIHPFRARGDLIVRCEAPIVDERVVSDSSGRRERRFVIVTRLKIGTMLYPIEVTLYNRETMSHRMLIGRSAMSQIMIDPTHAFLLGWPKGILRDYRKRAEKRIGKSAKKATPNKIVPRKKSRPSTGKKK